MKVLNFENAEGKHLTAIDADIVIVVLIVIVILYSNWRSRSLVSILDSRCTDAASDGRRFLLSALYYIILLHYIYIYKWSMSLVHSRFSKPSLSQMSRDCTYG